MSFAISIATLAAELHGIRNALGLLTVVLVLGLLFKRMH